MIKTFKIGERQEVFSAQRYDLLSSIVRQALKVEHALLRSDEPRAFEVP